MKYNQKAIFLVELQTRIFKVKFFYNELSNYNSIDKKCNNRLKNIQIQFQNYNNQKKDLNFDSNSFFCIMLTLELYWNEVSNKFLVSFCRA